MTAGIPLRIFIAIDRPVTAGNSASSAPMSMMPTPPRPSVLRHEQFLQSLHFHRRLRIELFRARILEQDYSSNCLAAGSSFIAIRSLAQHQQLPRTRPNSKTNPSRCTRSMIVNHLNIRPISARQLIQNQRLALTRNLKPLPIRMKLRRKIRQRGIRRIAKQSHRPWLIVKHRPAPEIRRKPAANSVKQRTSSSCQQRAPLAPHSPAPP